MATYFTTTPSSLVGSAYSTNFVHTLNSNYDYSVWHFGNGIYAYDEQSVSYAYDYPGTYQVSVTAGNFNGSVIHDSANVTTNFAYRDALIFTQVPPEFGMAGRKTSVPFVVSLTSSKVDEPISVCLYSYNSKSSPHFALPDRWKFIVPKWKFVDAETDEPYGNSILVKTTPLYKDSTVVGVSGQLSFYYIDDSSTGLATETEAPILLVATLSTENFSYPTESTFSNYKSYSNPKTTKASIVWHVNECPVTNYKITENYINDIYPIKWKDVPIPVMITCLYTPPEETGLTETSDVLGYPRTNEQGLLNPITLSLFENGALVSPSLYSLSEPLLYFKATEENGTPASGYIFTTVTPLTTFSGNLQFGIDSSVINQPVLEDVFYFPYGYPVYAQTFVNNPFCSNINVIAFYNYNFSTYESQVFDVYPTSVWALTSTNTQFNEITGTAATYGLSFNPILNRLYALDADQDSIIRFDAPYQLTDSISLSSLTNTFPSVPAYMSIDKFHNIWISMYNTHQLIKLDKNLNFLLSAAPNVSVPYDALVEGSPLVESSTIETDQDNNIWVSYAHPVSSMLIKFDSQGNQLCQATSLLNNSVPVSLAITPTKHVWVCCYNTNTVDLYETTTGQLLSSINSGFIHPSYVHLDREANVWFTHGYNFLSKYDVRTYQLSTWKFEDGLETITVHNQPYSSEEQQEALLENEIWAGLGIDVYNRVWVVDKIQNKVAVFKNTNPLISFNTTLTPSVDQDEASSAQVAGDWTGNRWYQKYASIFNQETSDVSTAFRVYDINDFEIAKVNETFDYSQYMKSLALPEILYANDQLFDGFLKSSVGDEVLYDESPGRVGYERVANFLQNHSDIETAEMDQLASHAQQLSVQTKSFGEGFPAAVNRLINLFSIPKHRLRGTVAYNEDFKDNIKEILEPTSTIAANEILVAKDRQYGTYQLIAVSPITVGSVTLNSYPLSQIEVTQMRTPLFDNYYFFRYEQDAIGYKGNVIDWDSKYTTISYTLSTAEEWYGDEGLADIMFNRLLTKQLFLE